MIDDVGKTIKAILYDRIVSPLFGTFILSWCAWNWRLILLFLSDSSTTIAKKFQYVDSELYPSNGVTFIYGLLLPATTTAFFIYVYPPIARGVYGYWREQQNKLKKVQIEKDGETPLKKEEAQEIRNQALLSELRYQEEREKRETRIRDLESLVKSLQQKEEAIPIGKGTIVDLGTIVEKEKTATNFLSYGAHSSEVRDGMLSVLRLLSQISPKGGVDEDEFTRVATSSNSELGLAEQGINFILHCLDNLIEGKYVLRAPNGDLYIQPKGRTVLVNKKFENEV
ncbi:hypothetical protein FGKAn22_19450 [Ferrigenium kumadai]|uniref:Uncharacterized protein n=1 Tax=Ferrigenium kumadai TaxID=1682490 RepID=A0AAN1T0N8_9PROT|nr:hypothetical protein [Ferrigenium kumadai]BBJ00253.1 hypothetical protein FGKAn22_19450 [Ferrigenium kumadai]